MASASVDGAPVPQQAQASLDGIVQQDAAKGRVPIHTFDPNSSPESKGAAAGKGEDKLGLENADVQTGAKGMSAARILHLPHARSKAVPLTCISVRRTRRGHGHRERKCPPDHHHRRR